MRVLLAVAVLLAFQVDGAVGSSRSRTGNLVQDPGLESEAAVNWQGSSAAVTRVNNRPHSGRHCLYVKDASDSYGQGNSAAMAVVPGHYYSEAWLRVDPKSPGLITCDIQFFDRDNKYLSSHWMGVSDSRNWTRIRGRVVVPSGAVTASIRLLPAGPSREYKGNVGKLRGACFGDDFYFSTLKDAITAGRATGDEFPGVVADPVDYDTPAPMRPHLYVTARKVPGLLSVAELRQAIKSGHRKLLWDKVRKRADADLEAEPIVAGTDANWIVCNDASQRILRASLAFLVTADDRYKESALQQIAVTFDTDKWPEHWRDDPGQPRNLPAGLRVGQLCAGIGLAYDWLHAGLTVKERKRIVAGLDRQGIQPYLKTVRQGNWQVAVLDNFMPNIVGGVGLAGMGLAEDHPDSDFLVRTARQRMKIYLSVFGPEGEWNESVDYSNSVRDTVEFYSGLRYWTTVRPDVSNDTTLAEHPFPQFCRWKMYMTLPPGRAAK
ncbi:MAG TPA: hypothetical protein DER64_02210, partial [Planctomycetaceae bacterium]|nr:hypothetical protein [Planctomycetaceae bacterium]